MTKLLRRVLLGFALLTLLGFGVRDHLSSGSTNPIQLENLNPGTSDWYPSNVDRGHQIEGYASATSVNAGGQISFFVNSLDPQYTLTIYRLGYYQGLGGRQMTSPVTLNGIAQPIPAPDPVTGMVECQWTNPYVLNVPANWVSGLYVAKLSGLASGLQRLVGFVVRNDGRQSDLMFQSSVTTAQAYNAWGGKSLYDFNSAGNVPAVKVSFNRPYDDSEGAGQILSWELNMAVFLEQEGYDVVYSTNLDTHESPAQMLLHKGFLSVGHDEYWSYEMRQNVIAARDNGVSLGFFSANVSYWQIRFEPSPLTGGVDRTIVCYKGLASDPAAANPATYYLVTTRWRDNHVTLPATPEDSFIGIMSNPAEPVDGDVTVANASNWVFANTGLANGSRLSGLLGYEVDVMYNDGNAPANLIDLAHSSYVFNGTTQFSDMTVYTAASGATVLAAGSIQWSLGLSDVSPWSSTPSRVNPAAQQITRNVLSQFINGLTSATPTPTASPSAIATPGPVTITAPSSGATVSGTVSVTIQKASNVSWANVYVDGIYLGSTPTTTFGWSSTTAANGSHGISATAFASNGTSMGTASITVQLQNGITGTPTPTIAPTATPTPAGTPAVRLSTTQIDFGDVKVGSSLTRVVTVTNSGTAPLSVNGVSTSSPFTQSNNCTSAPIAGGASCSIQVTYTPTSRKSDSSTLTITDNATGSPQAVSLKGRGKR